MDLTLNQTTYFDPVMAVGLFLLIIILVIFIFLHIWRYLARRGYRLPAEWRQTIFQVTVPKEMAGQKENSTLATREQIQTQISWAENLWASLGGIKPQKGFKAWLYGRQDEISLEIVAQDKLIYFYVVVPRFLEQYLEQQIQAQYPHAQVEKVEDYNFFKPHSQAAAAVLGLAKPDIFPLKTYRKMEVDSLNTITNALSKLESDEGGAIQILIRPVNQKWYGRARKVIQEVLAGKKLKEAMKLAGGRDWLDKTLSGAGKIFSQPKASEQTKTPQAPEPRLSAMDQELLKSIEEKSAKAALEANIRVVVSSPNETAASLHLNNIVNSFSQYNIYEYGNGFKVFKIKKIDKVVSNFIHRRLWASQSFVINTEELASLYHLPLPDFSPPNIHWLGAKKSAPPVNMPQEGIILGKNVYRGRETLVRLKKDDRRRHVYVIGMTGTGKSKLMVSMALQDIQNGEGVCYLDPHGTEVEELLTLIPPERINDVIYFNPADIARPLGLNMLEAKTPEEEDFATQEMIQIFYKLMPDPAMGGPMFEHYMRNAMLLLMADKNDPGTIVEIPRVFTDEEFRDYKLRQCHNLMVKSFWEKEYAASQRGSTAADMLSYVISKTGRFIENEMMRNIIGQPHSGFDFKKIMNERKILLVNLSKGKVGEMNSDLLGLILVSKLQLAAMSRGDLPEQQRPDFYLYIDEFQNYVTDSIAVILAEARKFRLNLAMAHQYVGQLVKNQNTAVRDAVFGNAGTIVSFRIGVEDTEMMTKQFAPVFNEFDLMNIEKFNAYIRPLIDLQPARPFNMQTFPPLLGSPEIGHAVIESSREKYGRLKHEVEAEILRRSKLGESVGVEVHEPLDMR